MRGRQSSSLSEEERQQIKAEAEKRKQPMSDFIRSAVLNVTFDRHTPEFNSSEIMNELSVISNMIKHIEDNRERELKMTLEALASRSPAVEFSLEQKILLNLKGRKLFLNQIAVYCQEEPAIMIQTLAKLQKDGKVLHNKQKRWCVA